MTDLFRLFFNCISHKSEFEIKMLLHPYRVPYHPVYQDRIQQPQHPDGQVDDDREGRDGGRDRPQADLHGLCAPHPR